MRNIRSHLPIKKNKGMKECRSLETPANANGDGGTAAAAVAEAYDGRANRLDYRLTEERSSLIYSFFTLSLCFSLVLLYVFLPFAPLYRTMETHAFEDGEMAAVDERRAKRLSHGGGSKHHAFFLFTL
ncbi:hypothetical protein TIFTF001_020631 [Ficus carica]|uniref:Uncharacterized protein n=1 Tax=Ficus carica TaxID=3494 RepID=A0AA88AGF8_FICCA|nr:hypothetical protein TIFTF001_020631 [Ficus carica]